MDDPVSKHGKHGRLFLYVITYTDNDPAFGELTTRRWAYNEQHAVDRFDDENDGFIAVSVKRTRAA